MNGIQRKVKHYIKTYKRKNKEGKIIETETIQKVINLKKEDVYDDDETIIILTLDEYETLTNDIAKTEDNIEHIQELENKIKNYESNLLEEKNKYNDLENSYSNQEKNYSKLEKEVETLRKEIIELKNEIGKHKDDINNRSTVIIGLQNQIRSNEMKVTAYENQSFFSRLLNRKPKVTNVDDTGLAIDVPADTNREEE